MLYGTGRLPQPKFSRFTKKGSCPDTEAWPHTRATLTAGTGISITNASEDATKSARTGPGSVASNSVTIANQYSPNSVFCDNRPTEIVDVVNPVTGKTWMDRNLGAQRDAVSSTEQQALGICINGVEKVMDINAAIQTLL